MKISSILLVVFVILVVISLVSIWFFPSVQDFLATNSMWNGISSFDDNFKAQNIDSLDALPALSENTALVAIPYLVYSNKEMEDLKVFVQNGGHLLLMDDYGYGNEVLNYFDLNAQFSGKTLLDPLFDYKNQYMPRITDFASNVKHSGVTAITFNYATTLTNIAPSAAIAWSSAASYLDSDGSGILTSNSTMGPFPVAAQYRLGKGVISIIADPSIIISGMLDRDSNYRFITYLISDNGKQRAILFDTSHLTKTPLDVSKDRLLGLREAMSGPYALVGITAMIFGVTFYYMRKGEAIG